MNLYQTWGKVLSPLEIHNWSVTQLLISYSEVSNCNASKPMNHNRINKLSRQEIWTELQDFKSSNL